MVAATFVSRSGEVGDEYIARDNVPLLAYAVFIFP